MSVVVNIFCPTQLESALLPPEPKPEMIVKREKARQRTLKAQGRWSEPPQPEKIAVFNDMTSWDACPVPLTVVLTDREDKPPWGLVTTARTQDGSLLRDTYHLRETIEERHRMDIVEPAKSKLRKKFRKLQQEFLHSLKNPRPP